MKREDFIAALGVLAKIRDTIMDDCNKRDSLHPDAIRTVRIELDTIKKLEDARKSLVDLRDYLLLD